MKAQPRSSRPDACVGLVAALAILACLAFTARSPAAEAPIPARSPAAEALIPLRYDLRPGDHLTYRERLERRVRSPAEESVARWEWTSHVLVPGEEDGALQVGIQRNRVQAGLVEYRETGIDRLERERPAFAGRLERVPARFSEANLLTDRGLPQLIWSAAREAPSELLYGVHELEPLPPSPVAPGATWASAGPFPFRLRFVGLEPRDGEPCARVEGSALEDTLRLRYWLGTTSGVLKRIEFHQRLPLNVGSFEETVTFELLDRRRDERVDAWLEDPGLREAVLAAWLVSSTLPPEATLPVPSTLPPEATRPVPPVLPPEATRPVPPKLPPGSARLYTALEGDSPTAIRQALALAYRHRLKPPPVAKLEPLLHHVDPRVRTLAVRMLEQVRAEVARPLLEVARVDPDYFVRQAVAAWEAARAAVAPDLAVGQPGWRCGEQPGWASQVWRQLEFPPHLAGTRMLGMETPSLRGWPYGMHVPEDYRGTEPFPLIVYLSGAPGRALGGITSTRETVARSGYLVVTPQAKGSWWTDASREVIDAVLQEVLRTYNVDHNRVYLVGSSNGGSGTLTFATLEPDRFAAAAPLMGSGLRLGTPDPPLIDNLVRMPLLFVHGVLDNVIGVEATREAVGALNGTRRRAPLEAHILEHRGHDLTLDRDEGLTLPFFQRFVRDPFPREVTLHAHSLRFNRAWWLQIDEKARFGAARLHASIDDANTIRIDARRVKKLRLLLRREMLPAAGPIRVLINDREVYRGAFEEDCAMLVRSWRQTADPFLAWAQEIPLEVP